MAYKDLEKKKAYDANYRETHPGCAKAWYLANPRRARAYQCKNHNISLEQYDMLLAAQHGVCAICGKPETARTGNTVRSLAIDHDHNCCPTIKKSCGRCIRGLLCSACNRGLGLFNDDTKNLMSAAAYLKLRRAGMVL